jgi:hypothetical protein
MKREFRLSSFKGFTVLEMLVATALLSTISILLFTALNQVTRLTAFSQGKGLLYQDVRTSIDQIGRELQQSTPYTVVVGGTTNDIFQFNADELHFVAVIDHQGTREEAEIHYAYDGTNSLRKFICFAGDTDWDLDSASIWEQTPTLTSDKYSSVVEGVSSFTVDVWTNAPPIEADKIDMGQWAVRLNKCQIPSYVRITVKAYDETLIRRWKTAQKLESQAASAITNQLRTFSTLVHIPLSEQ